jgi:hypothetical protein
MKSDSLAGAVPERRRCYLLEICRHTTAAYAAAAARLRTLSIKEARSR